MNHRPSKRPLLPYLAAALVALAATSVYISLDNAKSNAGETDGEVSRQPSRVPFRRGAHTVCADHGLPGTEAFGAWLSSQSFDTATLPADPALASMRPEMIFAAKVFSLADKHKADSAKTARKLLRARSPQDRATGGALLVLSGEMTDADMNAIADDAAILVPLVVGEWISDYGDNEDASSFLAILRERGIQNDSLVAYLASSATSPGGGRTALDILVPRMEEDEELSYEIAEIASGKDTSYDVREQILFKFLEPENKREGVAMLETQASSKLADESPAVAQMVARLQELAALPSDDDDNEEDVDSGSPAEDSGDALSDSLDDDDDSEVDYKVWDTPIRDISFLAESDLGLAVRSMANYLSYGLRRDDPDFEPVVEEGTYGIAKEFYEKALARSSTLDPEERFVLARLAADIERLTLYDPEFAPDGDEDDGEEIPVEVLNEEDSYLADILAEEDEGEDDEYLEEYDALSDEDSEDDEDDGEEEPEESEGDSTDVEDVEDESGDDEFEKENGEAGGGDADI